jgi:hypothetical protein
MTRHPYDRWLEAPYDEHERGRLYADEEHDGPEPDAAWDAARDEDAS